MNNQNMMRQNQNCGCSRGTENANVRMNMPKCTQQNTNQNMNMQQNTANTSCNRPVPDRNTLMKEIYHVGFAIIEATLFLDTHPNDAEALNFYHQMRGRYHEVMHMYNREYGPLLNTAVMNENYWSWVATPMPWEVEGC